MLRRHLDFLTAVLVVIASSVFALARVANAEEVDCRADSGALQPAIDAAAPGSTLHISVRCVGNFSVSKDLQLVSARGKPNFGRPALSPSSLDGDGSGTVLTIEGDVDVVVACQFGQLVRDRTRHIDGRIEIVLELLTPFQ